MRVGNSASSYPGRCMERQEETFYSRILMTRTVMTCLPENPVVIDIKPSSPPSWLQRLIE
ncbi:hypothetical protein A6A04_20355 [Paramagnetospirillum marisnigri]|uniref:Uncharacterized protein n=1 Tax=Paramagnetospirillum marisnigri TaxID=1285242 RepID=A0A178MHE3_9PROT|nr:hypothetical protein A6A04_20355 [Paramagnetospirillum marisnigri]